VGLSASAELLVIFLFSRCLYIYVTRLLKADQVFVLWLIWTEKELIIQGQEWSQCWYCTNGCLSVYGYV